jgi:hypothetical protein
VIFFGFLDSNVMMERFAKIKNFGPRRKLDVNAICRCCGLASDDKYPVLGQNPFSDDGVPFQEKVFKLTGEFEEKGIALEVTLFHCDRNPSHRNRQNA